MKSILSILLASVFLVGCSKSSYDYNPRYPRGSYSFSDTLKSIGVVDENYNSSAPRVSGLGSPVGVLVIDNGYGSVGLCSTSHVKKGVIVANAHCVVDDPRYGSSATRLSADKIHFIYYDKNGTRNEGVIKRFIYVGSVSSDDVSIMEIDTQDATNWDNFSGNILDTDAEAGVKPPVVHEVKVWSFDPYSSSSSHIGKSMHFNPKTCDASRTKFEVVKVTKDATTGKNVETPVSYDEPLFQFESAVHLFLDECSSDPIKGNSGSLITSSANPREVLGTFHWSLREKGKYSEDLIMRGNRKMDNQVTSQEYKFFTGTAFDSLFKRKPAANF